MISVFISILRSRSQALSQQNTLAVELAELQQGQRQLEVTCNLVNFWRVGKPWSCCCLFFFLGRFWSWVYFWRKVGKQKGEKLKGTTLSRSLVRRGDQWILRDSKVSRIWILRNFCWKSKPMQSFKAESRSRMSRRERSQKSPCFLSKDGLMTG